MAYTTIDKPSDYFNTNLYTGNNTETSHTVGFQPDFTWLKVRNAVGSHYLFDSVRLATKYLRTNSTGAEGTDANTLKSFDSNGYTVGTSNAVNTNGETMVGWNWLGANGTASNTDGSITSTVSANTTSGFSIVSYTGTGANATVGHGLGVAPKMYIVKNRQYVEQWDVYHESLGATKNLSLDSSAAAATQASRWNNTAPTSSVFSLGTSESINNSGDNLIAYCFAEKQGYSKFGSYTGNGNADGAFVYLGFKPAWVMTKRTDSSSGWHMQDNKRDGFNYNNHRLFADSSGAEETTVRMDLLSNGFKYRDGDGNYGTNIYMAFAENPFVSSNGVPATAR